MILQKRSMKKLIVLMSKFGAQFKPKNKFHFPIKIISSEIPLGIEYESGVSAQLKRERIRGRYRSVNPRIPNRICNFKVNIHWVTHIGISIITNPVRKGHILA